MKCRLWIIFFGFLPLLARAQTLGGAAVFQFLRLPGGPQLAALGGVNISNQTDDIGLSFHNPSLLRASMHGQVDASFNAMAAGINEYRLLAGYRYEPWNSVFSAGVQYFDYGEIPQTDPGGNILGTFHPVDYVVQVSAARAYERNWYYGLTLKFIHSAYGVYRSSGLALDAGFSYLDSSRGLQASFAALNMGTVLKTYAGSTAGELPFDLQLGISKRLTGAPFQFSLTAQRLQIFDLQYNDTAFNAANGLSSGSASFAENLFRHFVFSVQALIEKRIELTLGYNYLRRRELNYATGGNGWNGLSAGVGILLPRWQFRYARSYYQGSAVLNQFGIILAAGNWLQARNPPGR